MGRAGSGSTDGLVGPGCCQSDKRAYRANLRARDDGRHGRPGRRASFRCRGRLGEGDGLLPSRMLKGYAMIEKAELQHSVNNARALIDESGTGWDPYEVWLTRVWPQQRSIGLGRAGTAIPERSQRHICVSGYRTTLVWASRIGRGVMILLRFQLKT